MAAPAGEGSAGKTPPPTTVTGSPEHHHLRGPKFTQAAVPQPSPTHLSPRVTGT